MLATVIQLLGEGAAAIEQYERILGKRVSDARARVLIADGSQSVRETLERFLSQDYDVVAAASGEECLEQALSFSPELIILGVDMPAETGDADGMNGFDLLRLMKTTDLLRDVPVIAIGQSHSDADEERAFALGSIDYFASPFREKTILARIRTRVAIARQMQLKSWLCAIDPLTLLPNRRGYDERIRMEWGRGVRENSPLSYLMIDIDDFKVYNDTYGHIQGDALLREVSAVFMECVHRPSDYIARLGGEEFCMLLPNTDIDGALKIAEMTRRRVEEMELPTLDGLTITRTTISIGVASQTMSVDGSWETLAQTADANLYLAKASGRNCVMGTEKTQEDAIGQKIRRT